MFRDYPPRQNLKAIRDLALLIAIGLVLAFCSGCATTEPSSRRAEAVWQTLNVVDTLQTVQIARAPECYREVDPLTSRLIGEQPSEAGAVAVGLAYAWAHDRVSGWLDRRTDRAIELDTGKQGAWYVARITWHAVGLFTKARTVANNHSLGLRIGGSTCAR